MPENVGNEEKLHLKELKEQLTESHEPKEKVLTVFCHRHGISMDQCKKYYSMLVANGEIKEK